MRIDRRRVVQMALVLFGAIAIMAAPHTGAQSTRTADVELVFATNALSLDMDQFTQASTEIVDGRVIDVTFHQPAAHDGELHLRMIDAGTYRGAPVLFGLATFTDPLTGEARAGEVAGFDMSWNGRREIVAAIHDNRDGGRRVPFRLVFDPVPTPESTTVAP